MNHTHPCFPVIGRTSHFLLAVLVGTLLGCYRSQKTSETTVEDIKPAMTREAKQVEFRIGRADFVLVRIPPGEFDIGSPPGYKDAQPNEIPARRVRLSQAFYLGRFEVTQLQYQEVMGDDMKLLKRRGDSLPVYEMTYTRALEYCKKLSQLIGLTATLPTEAQWEYACRAGTTTRYYSGDTQEDLAKDGWYRENAKGSLHPVGQKHPNAWDLYDMHGNVWEPCIDFLPDYVGIQDKDPKGKVSNSRGVMRGGGWMHPAEYCRSATRLVTDNMFGGMGIRIAINPDVASMRE